MNITREKQIENLLVLHSIVGAQPANKINLDNYRCGAVFCIGGLAAAHPHFQALGIWPDAEGAPRANGLNWASDVANEYFGYSHLFERAWNTHANHKLEALNRIERATERLIAEESA
jgi:hypothetical protein